MYFCKNNLKIFWKYKRQKRAWVVSLPQLESLYNRYVILTHHLGEVCVPQEGRRVISLTLFEPQSVFCILPYC